jgi:hypothetical protein
VSEPTVRPLTAFDGAAARQLAHSALGGTRHLARTLELVERALGGRDPECVGLVSTTNEIVDGLLLHGSLAATAVEKVHVLVGSDVQSLARLTDALLRRAHRRMIICELSEGAEHANAMSALVVSGFTREGSVAAFFDDETALALLVLRRSSDTP